MEDVFKKSFLEIEAEYNKQISEMKKESSNLFKKSEDIEENRKSSYSLTKIELEKLSLVLKKIDHLKFSINSLFISPSNPSSQYNNIQLDLLLKEKNQNHKVNQKSMPIQIQTQMQTQMQVQSQLNLLLEQLNTSVYTLKKQIRQNNEDTDKAYKLFNDSNSLNQQIISLSESLFSTMKMQKTETNETNEEINYTNFFTNAFNFNKKKILKTKEYFDSSSNKKMLLNISPINLQRIPKRNKETYTYNKDKEDDIERKEEKLRKIGKYDKSETYEKNEENEKNEKNDKFENTPLSIAENTNIDNHNEWMLIKDASDDLIEQIKIFQSTLTDSNVHPNIKSRSMMPIRYSTANDQNHIGHKNKNGKENNNSDYITSVPIKKGPCRSADSGCYICRGEQEYSKKRISELSNEIEELKRNKMISEMSLSLKKSSSKSKKLMPSLIHQNNNLKKSNNKLIKFITKFIDSILRKIRELKRRVSPENNKILKNIIEHIIEKKKNYACLLSQNDDQTLKLNLNNKNDYFHATKKHSEETDLFDDNLSNFSRFQHELKNNEQYKFHPQFLNLKNLKKFQKKFSTKDQDIPLTSFMKRAKTPPKNSKISKLIYNNVCSKSINKDYDLKPRKNKEYSKSHSQHNSILNSGKLNGKTVKSLKKPSSSKIHKSPFIKSTNQEFPCFFIPKSLQKNQILNINLQNEKIENNYENKNEFENKNKNKIPNNEVIDLSQSNIKNIFNSKLKESESRNKEMINFFNIKISDFYNKIKNLEIEVKNLILKNKRINKMKAENCSVSISINSIDINTSSEIIKKLKKQNQKLSLKINQIQVSFKENEEKMKINENWIFSKQLELESEKSKILNETNCIITDLSNQNLKLTQELKDKEKIKENILNMQLENTDLNKSLQSAKEEINKKFREVDNFISEIKTVILGFERIFLNEFYDKQDNNKVNEINYNDNKQEINHKIENFSYPKEFIQPINVSENLKLPDILDIIKSIFNSFKLSNESLVSRNKYLNDELNLNRNECLNLQQIGALNEINEKKSNEELTLMKAKVDQATSEILTLTKNCTHLKKLINNNEGVKKDHEKLKAKFCEVSQKVKESSHMNQELIKEKNDLIAEIEKNKSLYEIKANDYQAEITNLTSAISKLTNESFNWKNDHETLAKELNKANDELNLKNQNIVELQKIIETMKSDMSIFKANHNSIILIKNIVNDQNILKKHLKKEFDAKINEMVIEKENFINFTKRNFIEKKYIKFMGEKIYMLNEDNLMLNILIRELKKESTNMKETIFFKSKKHKIEMMAQENFQMSRRVKAHYEIDEIPKIPKIPEIPEIQENDDLLRNHGIHEIHEIDDINKRNSEEKNCFANVIKRMQTELEANVKINEELTKNNENLIDMLKLKEDEYRKIIEEKQEQLLNLETEKNSVLLLLKEKNDMELIKLNCKDDKIKELEDIIAKQCQCQMSKLEEENAILEKEKLQNDNKILQEEINMLRSHLVGNEITQNQEFKFKFNYNSNSNSKKNELDKEIKEIKLIKEINEINEIKEINDINILQNKNQALILEMNNNLEVKNKANTNLHSNSKYNYNYNINNIQIPGIPNSDNLVHQECQVSLINFENAEKHEILENVENGENVQNGENLQNLKNIENKLEQIGKENGKLLEENKKLNQEISQVDSLKSSLFELQQELADKEEELNMTISASSEYQIKNTELAIKIEDLMKKLDELEHSKIKKSNEEAVFSFSDLLEKEKNKKIINGIVGGATHSELENKVQEYEKTIEDLLSLIKEDQDKYLEEKTLLIKENEDLKKEINANIKIIDESFKDSKEMSEFKTEEDFKILNLSNE